MGTLQISDKILSVFYCRSNEFKYINYNISSNGIKWSINENEKLLDGNITKIYHSNNYLFCVKSTTTVRKTRRNRYENTDIDYYLFKINK